MHIDCVVAYEEPLDPNLAPDDDPPAPMAHRIAVGAGAFALTAFSAAAMFAFGVTGGLGGIFSPGERAPRVATESYFGDHPMEIDWSAEEEAPAFVRVATRPRDKPIFVPAVFEMSDTQLEGDAPLAAAPETALPEIPPSEEPIQTEQFEAAADGFETY